MKNYTQVVERNIAINRKSVKETKNKLKNRLMKMLYMKRKQ